MRRRDVVLAHAARWPLLTTVTDVPPHPAAARSRGRGRLLEEVVAVAHAVGVKVRPAFVDEALARYRTFRDNNGHAKSSLLVDIEHGRMTEIDLLHGTLVRLAAEHNVDVPVSATLCAVIRISVSSPTLSAEAAAPVSVSDH